MCDPNQHVTSVAINEMMCISSTFNLHYALGVEQKIKAVIEQIRDGILKQLINLWFVYSDSMRSKDFMLNISSHEDTHTTLYGSELSFMYDMLLYPTKL